MRFFKVRCLGLFNKSKNPHFQPPKLVVNKVFFFKTSKYHKKSLSNQTIKNYKGLKIMKNLAFKNFTLKTLPPLEQGVNLLCFAILYSCCPLLSNFCLHYHFEIRNFSIFSFFVLKFFIEILFPAAKDLTGLSLSYHQLEASMGGSWQEGSTLTMFVKR